METENLNQETEVKEKESCKCCKCCKYMPHICMGILAVAVIVLYILFFVPKCGGAADVPEIAPDEQLPIAYVEMDSLLAKSTIYQQMQEELLAQQERSRATLNQKASALQADAQDFQNKLENRAFLSEERARSEQERIMRMQQELEQLDARLTQELAAKQAYMLDSLMTIIDNTVEQYNADKGYHFIFSNTGSAVILYGNPGYDITNDILTLLNK